MIRESIIIYYENDSKLGNYFKKCADHSSAILSLNGNIKKDDISNTKCETVFINEITLPEYNNPTLIIILSHGSEDYFYKENEIFFGKYNIGHYCLTNGLVYSIACSVGSGFATALVNTNNQSSFYGYNKPTSIMPDYERVFIECDIFPLKDIIEGKTLEKTKELAKERFNKNMENVSGLAAAYLRDARDSIVIYGKTSTSLV